MDYRRFIGSTAYMVVCGAMVACTTILIAYMVIYPDEAGAHRCHATDHLTTSETAHYEHSSSSHMILQCCEANCVIVVTHPTRHL